MLRRRGLISPLLVGCPAVLSTIGSYYDNVMCFLCCAFSFSAFTENLKERGLLQNAAVQAGIDRLHRLRLRARDQATIDFIIDELIRFIHICFDEG
jgi:hypothetical protein